MKLSHLAGLASLACIGAAIACGSSSNKGGGGGSDGGGGGEGGSLDGGGGETGPAKLPFVGSVSASTTVAGTTTTYALTGAFVAVTDAGAAANDGGTCLGTQSGSCCFVPPGALAEAGAGGDAGAVSLVSAGTLSVKDGTSSLANISPGSNNGYAITNGGTSNPSVTWKGGDSLAVSADGGTVEAFSGTMTAVEDFQGLNPALTYKTATTVPIASNLAISWTAGNGTTVHVLIDALKGTANAGTISCSVADSAGTVSVSSTLLGNFASGDTGLITLTRSSVTQVTGPNATVGLISTSSTGGTAKFQ